MGINILDNYLSRGQVREYLGYILENGVDEIVESPDNVSATDPLPNRIGSSINSIKIYHVARHLGESFWLTKVGMVFISNDVKPDLPVGTSVIGVFYLSKHGRDYSGAPDQLGPDTVQGDIGTVAWLDSKNWDTAALGESTNGTNYRLFVFWSADESPIAE